MENKEQNAKITEAVEENKDTNLVGEVFGAGIKLAKGVGALTGKMFGGIGAIGDKAVELVNRPKPKEKEPTPVTLADYQSYGDNRPNVIMIVDDNLKGLADSDVVGYLKESEGAQVLFLYDFAVEKSGLSFRPVVDCDTVYCVHPLDRKIYVNALKLVDEINKEKTAELQEIARCIGAKSCVVEILETNGESSNFTAGQETTIKTTGSDVSAAMAASGKPLPYMVSSAIKDKKGEGKFSLFRKKTAESGVRSYSRSEAEFEGGGFAKRPTLKWFKDDAMIESIIASREEGAGNVMKNNTFTLVSSAVRAFSKKVVAEVSLAVSQSKGDSESGVQEALKREQNTAFLYTLEF